MNKTKICKLLNFIHKASAANNLTSPPPINRNAKNIKPMKKANPADVIFNIKSETFKKLVKAKGTAITQRITTSIGYICGIVKLLISL